MEKRTIQLKDPTELRPHPLKKSLPKAAEWQKGGESFNALLEDVRERGIDTPLLITSTNEILDGEVRWLAAKALRLDEVPTLEVPFACAASIILALLLQRQHLSKGALAYLAFPLLASAFMESGRRRMQRLTKGQQIPVAALSAATGKQTEREKIAAFAATLGISQRLLWQAKSVHELFARNPEFKAKMEPRLLRHHGGEGEDERPVGLGAILAGDAGERLGGAPNNNQLELFKAHLKNEFIRFAYWTRLTEAEQREVFTAVKTHAIQQPPENLEAMADYHAALARHLKQLAREAVEAA
jgi:hypothetical protein